jgi:alkanesulfonate monooxygenase SsuD/methylene tetrahydromethanopterin reductase-like flavin-dependent oxidoreductase (luciferase family)
MHEILTADDLGLREVWIREHASLNGPMPFPEMFIAKAAALTRQIRIGSGRHLLLHDPLQVAGEVATCDQLIEGRYLFGYGPGGGNNERLGGDQSARTAKTLEYLDVILRAWTTPEPFDFDGKYWSGKKINVVPKPLQQPYPTTACASASPEAVEVAGREGHGVLFADYEGPRFVRDSYAIYAQAARAVGRAPSRGTFRICRFVYVTDSVDRAREELRESLHHEIEREKRTLHHHFSECMPPSGKIEDINFDFLVDAGYYFVGDPDTVYDRLKGLYDEVGGFGVFLLRVGADRATRDGRARSMRLFMEHIAPRLRTLGADLAE